MAKELVRKADSVGMAVLGFEGFEVDAGSGAMTSRPDLMGDFSKPVDDNWEATRIGCNAFTLGFLSALRSQDRNLRFSISFVRRDEGDEP